jgi:hypothetical protein
MLLEIFSPSTWTPGLRPAFFPVIPAKAEPAPDPIRGIHVHRNEAMDPGMTGTEGTRIRQAPFRHSGLDQSMPRSAVRPLFRHPSPCAGTSSSFRKFHVISTERTALCNISYSLRFLAPIELTVLLCHYVDALLVAAGGRSHGAAEDCPRGSGLQPRYDRGESLAVGQAADLFLSGRGGGRISGRGEISPAAFSRSTWTPGLRPG